MTNSAFKTYAQEHGGRVLLLLLLFLLAIYQFIHAGFNAFAITCLSPLLILAVLIAFRHQMIVFWLLIVINWLIQFKDIPWRIPTSLPNELLELLLIAIALIDIRNNPHFKRGINIMLLALLIWFGLCFLEIFNDTCNLGINIGAWYSGVRLMALQLLWILLIFCLYITSPKILMRYIKLWACLSLFSAFWTWKMINLGFTHTEQAWLNGPGHVTHLLSGGTLIRYWSTFSDAANYGCNAAASALAFIIIGITTNIKKDKIFFLITGIIVAWGMFQSGTRTAIFCLIGGFLVFLVLSRSFRIIIPSAILGAFFLFILVFTDIGNGNQQIRRMRSAFDKSDASANVRDINKAAIAKYIKDAPWGIGIGMYANDIPAWNKYKILSEIPPDSEYVFIWVRTGPIGVSIFTFCMVLMLSGASFIVMFKLKSRTLIGIGSAMCSAFAAINLGGYANQVLFQYPNGLTFFGGLAIVYVLPFIEKEWINQETKVLTEQKEKRRLRLEKIEQMRVKPWYSWIYKYL